MMIDMLARKLLELDQEELEQVLESAKENNEDVIEVLEESLEEL